MRMSQRPLLLFLVLVTFSSVGSATTYYVDSVNGNDSNARTSAAEPWQTVSKVNAMQFSPGDSVVFKRGDVWRETLAVPSSGSAGSVITFAAYGSGPKPIISGADLLTGWSVYSGNIYRAPLAFAPRIVLRDGLLLVPETSIGNLTADGEWYYDGSVTLYVFSTTNPSAHTMEASHRGNAVLLYNKSYVTLQNLNVEYANSINLQVSAANSAVAGITISGVDSVRSATDGIDFIPSGTGTIDTVNITYVTDTHSGCGTSGGQGIAIGYDLGARISNVTISNLHESYFSVPDNPASAAKPSAWGLNLMDVTNATITNFEVDHAGAMGISLQMGTNHVTITDGLTHDNGQSNAQDMDGIGIGNDGSGTSYVTIQNVESYSNHGTGMNIATTSSSHVHDHTTIEYCQIYANGTYGYENGGGHTNQVFAYNLVYNNTLSGIFTGTGSTGGPALVVYGNTIYGNGVGGAGGTSDNIYVASSGVVLKNNIVAQATGNEILVSSSGSYTITSDYNDWYHSAGGNFMSWRGTAYGLAGWQSHSGQDAHSLSVDPQFVSSNPSGPNDFKLRPTSPLIGAGTNLGAAYEYGLDPQSANFPYTTFNQNLAVRGWDIGAFGFRQSFVLVVR